MFAHMGCISPPGIIAAPVNTLTKHFDPSLPESLTFAKPFPVQSQQWSMFQPEGKISTIFPDGWRHPEFEHRFGLRFPANLQIFAPNAGNPGIPSWF